MYNLSLAWFKLTITLSMAFDNIKRYIKYLSLDMTCYMTAISYKVREFHYRTNWNRVYTHFATVCYVISFGVNVYALSFAGHNMTGTVLSGLILAFWMGFIPTRADCLELSDAEYESSYDAEFNKSPMIEEVSMPKSYYDNIRVEQYDDHDIGNR